ncbi:MAG TPA: class I SAM-dependent methyltransferase [Rhodothermales bacterium]|nr:class I SAM-dependent methyltransferase [Rhodothermales bacterium]
MLERIPEQEIVMVSRDSVEAFDRAGLERGPLFPIYHVNSTGYSRHLPPGAVVVDLFCGPARFISYLLQGRPDVSAIGIDLSSKMLDLAAENLRSAGLADRVRLIQGDGASASELVQDPVHGVSCLSALHHCPSMTHLVEVLGEIRKFHDRGAAVWLFDLVRPDTEETVKFIPAMHEVSQATKLPAAFKEDWMNSLRAGWTFDEFKTAMGRAGISLHSSQANYSQLHWAPSPNREELYNVPWARRALTSQEEKRMAKLKELLRFDST